MWGGGLKNLTPAEKIRKASYLYTEPDLFLYRNSELTCVVIGTWMGIKIGVREKCSRPERTQRRHLCHSCPAHCSDSCMGSQPSCSCVSQLGALAEISCFQRFLKTKDYVFVFASRLYLEDIPELFIYPLSHTHTHTILYHKRVHSVTISKVETQYCKDWNQ